VHATRRAYRLRYHPDRFAHPELKARAEQTFKEAEKVFRQILDHGGGHGGP
jgi:DnaJ-class molecular chaperone